MHIGKDDKTSKTKAMYFPPKLLTKTKTPEVSTKEDTFPVKDGYVGFTNKFKCLGSLITTDLKDRHEIESKI
jgi:hypothetical protein